MCVSYYMSVITQEGVSALMWAAVRGHTEAVIQLVKAGANVDMQTEVCQYIYVVHDVNVQNHTSTPNSLVSVTHYNNYTYIVHVCIIINLRRACAARVTVCHSVCLSVCLLPRFLPLRATRRPKSDANGFSTALASFLK